MTVTPVRPLRRGDLPEVLAIEACSNPSPWGEGHFLPFAAPADPAGTENAERRHGARLRGWVAEGGDGAILGFACASAVADEVELQSIAVTPACRGRGIATALLESLLDWARAAGYRTLHLEVRAGNAPALGLYRRFGFAQSGLRRGYYQDNAEDALLLSREIRRAGPVDSSS